MRNKPKVPCFFDQPVKSSLSPNYRRARELTKTMNLMGDYMMTRAALINAKIELNHLVRDADYRDKLEEAEYQKQIKRLRHPPHLRVKKSNKSRKRPPKNSTLRVSMNSRPVRQVSPFEQQDEKENDYAAATINLDI